MSVQPLSVVIRADASAQIGSGHVKRCLSLAMALIDAGAEVLFVARDLGVDVYTLAKFHGVAVELLPRPGAGASIELDVAHAQWAEVPWHEDVQDTANAVANRRVDWVIVDHYSFDARWHGAIGRQLGAAIAVIDDLADRTLEAKLVIDQNYAADHRAKYLGRVAPDVKILGGPRFALLSAAYRDAPRYAFSDDCRSIGIFMGGIDAPDWSSVVLRACREHAHFAGYLEVATTSANPNLASLLALCEGWPRTVLCVDLPDLTDFFARHDLQIGAGGGATWERCCIGPPTLALACAENQRMVIAELKGLGAVATLEASDDLCEPAIGRAILKIAQDPLVRREIATRARSLVDGRGALRVALYLAASRIQLRDVRREDAALMYEWRNHPSTRAMSSDAAEIGWPEHQRWLDRALVDADRLLQIATIGAVPMGVIRFDGIGRAQAEVSLYLDPGLHGLGLGRLLLKAGEERARLSRPGLRHFVATVLDTNMASRRMFETAGYVCREDSRLVKELGV